MARAFISGGGSGIGLRLTQELLKQGAGVAVFDLEVSLAVRGELEKLAASDGAAVSFYEVNVCDALGLASAASEAARSVGSPDLAINCAGIQVCKTFDELSAQEFDRVVAVNLGGSRNFAAAVLPLMTSGARLALVASLAGFVPNYGYAAYNASKFGVVGLAGALRLECKPRGIDVSVICPPEVDTPMVTAERATGEPISLKLKEFAGTLSLEQACSEILAGLERGSTTIIPGWRARLTRRLAQIVPSAMNAVSDRMVAQALKASGSN